MHVGFFIVILYMYESSKDNINSYICGLHLYIYIYIYIYMSVCGFFKLAGCIYMYVCEFLKLASLSKLIFGRFFLQKKKKVGSIYVCVCVCVCVDHQSW